MSPAKPRIGRELPGLPYACQVLASGRAVALPNPAPMTYGLVATTARVINAVKRRPLGQPVAASVHSRDEWLQLVPCLELPSPCSAAVRTLLELRLSVLLPLRADVPAPVWIRPAVHDDQICVFDGNWLPTSAIWESFPHLFGSSANRTGQPPARSADDARAVFGLECTVVGDSYDGPRRLAAGSMVALDRQGRLRLHRSGAHDQSYEGSRNAYLELLADRVGLPVGASNGEPG